MKLIISLIFIFIMILLRGFVLVDLWEWFIVPLGLIRIGFFHALGISILVALLTYEGTDGSKKEWYEPLVKSLAITLFSWWFGYIYFILM